MHIRSQCICLIYNSLLYTCMFVSLVSVCPVTFDPPTFCPVAIVRFDLLFFLSWVANTQLDHWTKRMVGCNNGGRG